MEKKREVDQEELVVTCLLCATAIPLYPSPTFAVNRTSSQSAAGIETAEVALRDHCNC
jgi:hypothetical protein